MTNRCRYLIVLACLGIVAGALRSQNALTALSATCLLWVFWSWMRHRVRVTVAWKRLRVERKINGNSRSTTLWCERIARVQIRLWVEGGALPGYVKVRDLLPDALQVVEGQRIVHCLADQSTILLDYDCRLLSPGLAKFFGLHFRFEDPQGLFVEERVLHADHTVRVLPAFDEVKDPRSHIKRVNSIPQHGIHQLKRSGMGSELLELREYQPGDPPKSIAWKVSARRETLMTRQYESEVPMRVTLMLDASSGSRSQSLNQLSKVAATISRACLSAGDAVGIVTNNSSGINRMRPGAGDRAFYRVLEMIAEATQPENPAIIPVTERSLRWVHRRVAQRYPQWLHRHLLQFPFSIFPIRQAKRQALRQRRELATVFAELYDLNATQQVELTYDDKLLGRWMATWLKENGLYYAPARNANPDDAGDANLDWVARELTRGVAYAKDNELFVLCGDWLSPVSEPVWNDLKKSIRHAIACHHRVLAISACRSRSSGEGFLNQTEKLNIQDLYSDLENWQIESVLNERKRAMRSCGARLVLATDNAISTSVLAEAELAGTGRSARASR